MTFKEKLALLKWVPVGCLMIGLCIGGRILKAYDRYDDARNLKKQKTGKTRGL